MALSLWFWAVTGTVIVFFGDMFLKEAARIPAWSTEFLVVAAVLFSLSALPWYKVFLLEQNLVLVMIIYSMGLIIAAYFVEIFWYQTSLSWNQHAATILALVAVYLAEK